MDTTKNRRLLVGGAAAALVLGAGAVAGAAVGAGPFETDDSGLDGPSDLSDATAATTPDSAPDGFPSGGVDGARTEATTFVDIPIGGTQTLAAGAAGFATVTRDANGLRVVAVAPAPGWVFEIEPGDEPGEAEVDFRNGVSRVQLDVELEDGAVRVRVRTRGVAATPGATLPDGTLPRVDNSGPGSLNSGPGSIDDGSSGNSGPGSGSVDDSSGSNSGPGGGGGGDDDPGFDDHGGRSGHSGSGGGED